MSAGAASGASTVTHYCHFCKTRHASAHFHSIRSAANKALVLQITGLRDDRCGPGRPGLTGPGELRLCCLAFKKGHPKQVQNLHEHLLPNAAALAHAARNAGADVAGAHAAQAAAAPEAARADAAEVAETARERKGKKARKLPDRARAAPSLDRERADALQQALEKMQKEYAAIREKAETLEAENAELKALKETVPDKDKPLSMKSVKFFMNQYRFFSGVSGKEFKYLKSCLQRSRRFKKLGHGTSAEDLLLQFCSVVYAGRSMSVAAEGASREQRNLSATVYAMAEAIVDGLDPKHAPSFVREIVNGKPIFAGGRVDIEALARVTKRTAGRDRAFSPNPFSAALLAIIDGSGTTIFNPGDHDVHATLWCYWKKESPVRWYIVVDAKGRILFVSSVYEGKTSDKAALEMTNFFEWSKKEFGVLGEVELDDGHMLTVVWGVDAGYEKMMPLGPNGLVAVTGAAKAVVKEVDEENKSDAAAAATASTSRRGKRKRRAAKIEPQVFRHPRFSHYRSVVERVIGWLKQTCRMLHGPVYYEQYKLVQLALYITAALSNRALSANPAKFLKD